MFCVNVYIHKYKQRQTLEFKEDEYMEERG